MPTARLTEECRRSLLRNLIDTAERCNYAHPFPIAHQHDKVSHTWIDILHSTIKPEVLEAYRVLHEATGKFGVQTAYDFELFVLDRKSAGSFALHRITVQFENSRMNLKMLGMPRTMNGLLIANDSPYHAKLVDWCRDQHQTQLDTRTATSYLDRAIQCSTTAGQIKRCLPKIVPFLPNSLRSSFADAERMSRIPQRFKACRSYEKEQTTYRMLAMGQMLGPVDVTAKWYAPKLSLTITDDRNYLNNVIEGTRAYSNVGTWTQG